jgi:ABC-type transporter Mla subunit MlaD
MENLPIFIALTAFAILLQAGILVAMYVTMRKSSQRIETLAAEVRSKILPTIEQAQSIVAEMRPRIEIITENVEQTTTQLRAQLQRIDAAVSDAVDRGRLQIIRADELLSRTLDRVEHTSDVVQKTVVSPVRHISGIMQGITVGLEFLLNRRARGNGSMRERRAVPQDEMFI